MMEKYKLDLKATYTKELFMIKEGFTLSDMNKLNVLDFELYYDKIIETKIKELQKDSAGDNTFE